MTAKRNTSTLKNKADKLFGQIIRSRGRCQRCDRQPPEVSLQCAHILSRRFTATRWDENNALCLCAGCHFWAHNNPIEFTKLVEGILGTENLEKLLEKARSYAGRVSRVDYEEIVADLKERAA